MGRLFGTDGVRGVANRDLTPEMAFRLGQAGAYVLSKEHPHPKIVIGKDTRISGDMLEAALIAGICSVGADVLQVGILPTPGIAFLTRKLEASAGVVISASHNPVQDNGIKFFSSTGHKLPDAVEDEIESIVLSDTKPWEVPIAGEVGRVRRIGDAEDRYIEFLKGTVGRLDGLKVVIDASNGAAYRVGPRVLRDLGVEVIAIFDTPDGININAGCGSTHPELLQQAVLEHGADFGLANDGDADRLIAVDNRGEIVDGDFILVICALALKAQKKLVNNAIVVTVMSNLGLHIALKDAGIRVYETQVGDRYVMEELLSTGSRLGGEQSGHIIFLEHNTTGDGLLTALQLASVVKEQGKPMSELVKVMRRLPQVLINTRVRDKDSAMNSPFVLQRIREIGDYLGERGRILVRPSGTEPLVRVMVEGEDQSMLNEMAQSVIDIIVREQL